MVHLRHTREATAVSGAATLASNQLSKLKED